MKKLYSFLIVIIVVVMFNSTFAQQSKKKILFDTALKKNLSISAQSLTVPYTFSYSTGVYSNLTGTTSLNGGLTWDDPQFTVPIGFNFILWNDTISTIELGGLGGWLAPSFSGLQPFIYYLNDIADRKSDTVNWSGQPGSLSNISYLTSGNPGSRILKIEWNNAGFYDDIYIDNASTDYLNFQMWLYEGSNNIEIRFGQNSILQDSLVYFGYPGPVVGVGLYDFNMDTVFFFCLQGNPASPSSITSSVDLNSSLSLTTLASDPPDGIIYKFSWFFVGINELENQNHLADVYPNPVGNYAEVHWKATPFPENARIEITDMLGRIAYHQRASFDNGGRINIPVSLLASGSYILKITSEDKVIFKKLVKE